MRKQRTTLHPRTKGPFEESREGSDALTTMIFLGQARDGFFAVHSDLSEGLFEELGLARAALQRPASRSRVPSRGLGFPTLFPACLASGGPR